MTCSNGCGHNDCRPCIEYIPCFGPTGPVGPTATNQFLSLGAGVGATTLPAVQTPISFNIPITQNGTDISGTATTNTILLAPNHSYYISYNINATSLVAAGGANLGGVLVVNNTPIAPSAANTTTTVAGYASISGQTIVTTVGNTTSTLQLATTATANIFTLANAGISVIELL